MNNESIAPARKRKAKRLRRVGRRGAVGSWSSRPAKRGRKLRKKDIQAERDRRKRVDQAAKFFRRSDHYGPLIREEAKRAQERLAETIVAIVDQADPELDLDGDGLIGTDVKELRQAIAAKILGLRR